MDFLNFIDVCDKLFLKYSVTEELRLNGYRKVYSSAQNYIGDPKVIFAVIDHFRKKLLILHYQKNIDYLKYFPVLDFLRQAARSNSESGILASSSTNWERLLDVLIEGRNQLHPSGNLMYEKLYSHCHAFAHAYIKLENFGVEFVERDYKIYISDSSFDRIENEIDQLCRAYGGDNLLNTLAERLGGTYNSTTGRFMEYRNVALGAGLVAIPFGYLIAIASKYAGTSGKGTSYSFERLLEFITILIVIYEIQPYGELEAMYFEADFLTEFITKNILYDGFVGIAQTNSGYASGLIKFIKNKFSNASYTSYGIKIKDISRTALALISLSKNKRFSRIGISELSSKAGISQYKVITVMDKFLCVPIGSVNSDLRFPPVSLAIDHYFKPAIKKGREYIIFPRSIASLGCLNTVCNSIGFPNGKWSNPVDSELGYAIEDFLRDAFSKKGISIAYGVRSDGNEDLEVDMICETDSTVYIFEMKKKGLTRKAQSGNAVQIYQDLADSVLATHFQAMRIERILRDNGSLTLLQKDIEKTVFLKGRMVRRISVSFQDFGALQDKTIFQRILTIATHCQLNHPDVLEDKKLNKWRDLSLKLRDLAIENDEIEIEDKQFKKVPFHSSLFMSVPHIVMLLEYSVDVDNFFKYIESFISMTTGCRDAYSEFLHKLNLFEQLDKES